MDDETNPVPARGWVTMTDTVRGITLVYAAFSIASAITMASVVHVVSYRPIGPGSPFRPGGGGYSSLATDIADLASVTLLLTLVGYNVWSARTRRLNGDPQRRNGLLLRHWTLRTWRIAVVANILLGVALQATLRRRPTLFMDDRSYLITLGRPILSAIIALLLVVGLTHIRRRVRDTAL